MWLKLYQSASIWLCLGPTGPHSPIAPQVQIGGLSIARRIAAAIAMIASAATRVREERVMEAVRSRVEVLAKTVHSADTAAHASRVRTGLQR